MTRPAVAGSSRVKSDLHCEFKVYRWENQVWNLVQVRMSFQYKELGNMVYDNPFFILTSQLDNYFHKPTVI